MDITAFADLTRDEAIIRIRAALKARTGRAWSVTGGRGSDWGWITVKPRGGCTPEARALLASVLGFENDGRHVTGTWAVESKHAARVDAVMRAETGAGMPEPVEPRRLLVVNPVCEPSRLLVPAFDVSSRASGMTEFPPNRATRRDVRSVKTARTADRITRRDGRAMW